MTSDRAVRKCPCGEPLTHFNQRRCPPCAKIICQAQDRANKGIVIREDALVCPVCGDKMNVITNGHLRKHGYTDAETFKAQFGMLWLKAPSMRAEQTAFMQKSSNTKGRKRTATEIQTMRDARKGKGVGVCGKYARTDTIKAKIAAGVGAFYLENPSHANKNFKNGWRLSHKADQDVWFRSSWEERVLKVLDHYDEIEEIKVEPFAIPYLFDGVRRSYTPDLLVVFEGGIKELWEIKPAPFVHLPKNQAKFSAMQAYADSHDMHARIVTLENIERMERATAASLAAKEPGLSEPWYPNA